MLYCQYHYHVADVHDIPAAPFEDPLWSISDRSEMRAWFDSQFPFFIVVHWHFNILGRCAMKVGDLFYETVEFTEYYYLHYESTMAFKIHCHWLIDWS